MKAGDVGNKIQGLFDWIKLVLEPVENRWIILCITVFMYILLRAVGGHGIAEILAMIYIMYWVTLRGPSQERDQ